MLVPALVCVPVTVDMLCVPVPVDPCWVPAELVSLLMLAGGIAFDWAQAGAVNAKAAPNTRQALCSFMTDSSWCSRAAFSGPRVVFRAGASSRENRWTSTSIDLPKAPISRGNLPASREVRRVSKV